MTRVIPTAEPVGPWPVRTNDAVRPILVNFGYNPWSAYWKRNQSVVSMLLKRGVFDAALFVNRELWPGDLLRAPGQFLRPPFRDWAAAVWPRAVERNLMAFTPLVFNRGGRLRVLNRPDLRRITAPLSGDKWPAVVVVNFLSPFLDEVMAQLPIEPVGRVFDFSDDFSKFSSNPAEQQATAREIEGEFAKADLVLSVNERMNEWARTINPASVTVRNATNFFAFAETPCPSMRRSCPPERKSRPVIGYVGWLNSLRLDVPLLEHLARSRPEWTFLFVGPKVDSHPLGHVLPAMPNVHVLPPVEYSQLPGVLTGLDVAVLPNQINSHTDGNDPIKVYDYLASGRPVVATRTAGTREFGGLLRLADTPEQFLRAVEEALAETDAAAAQARVEAARRHSWDERIRIVEQALYAHVPAMSAQRR